MQMAKTPKGIRKPSAVRKVCEHVGCGEVFYGHFISKYCLEHRGIKHSKKVVDTESHNRVIKHGLTTCSDAILNCDFCGEEYKVRFIPRVYVYPRHCETHRVKHKRVPMNGMTVNASAEMVDASELSAADLKAMNRSGDLIIPITAQDDGADISRDMFEAVMGKFKEASDNEFVVESIEDDNEFVVNAFSDDDGDDDVLVSPAVFPGAEFMSTKIMGEKVVATAPLEKVAEEPLPEPVEPTVEVSQNESVNRSPQLRDFNPSSVQNGMVDNGDEEGGRILPKPVKDAMTVKGATVPISAVEGVYPYELSGFSADYGTPGHPDVRRVCVHLQSAADAKLICDGETYTDAAGDHKIVSGEPQICFEDSVREKCGDKGWVRY